MAMLVLSALLCWLCLSVCVKVFAAGCRVDDGVTSCHDLCLVPAGAELVLFSGDVLALNCLPASVKVCIDKRQYTSAQTIRTVIGHKKVKLFQIVKISGNPGGWSNQVLRACQEQRKDYWWRVWQRNDRRAH
jgi:hypothetical protein